jgi:hypothetical protein
MRSDQSEHDSQFQEEQHFDRNLSQLQKRPQSLALGQNFGHLFHQQLRFLLGYCSPTTILRHVFAELLESLVVVMSNVSKRLAMFLGDFRKGITFEEMEPQGLSLILGQIRQHGLQIRSSHMSLDGIIIELLTRE